MVYRKNNIAYEAFKRFEPSIARMMKKIKNGDGYETYPSLKKAGHKMRIDFSQMLLEHYYLKKVYIGGQYEEEVEVERFKVLHPSEEIWKFELLKN